jgi:predicted permease
LSAELSDRLARWVFLFGMPVVLAFGAAGVDYAAVGEATYLLAGVLATLLVTGLSCGWGYWRGFGAAERAVFVQGAFRSNLGIIGIALCAAAHGIQGVTLAALPVALLTLLYNVIAVPLLAAAGSGARPASPLLLGVARNPLIIGITIGLAVSLLEIPLPPPVMKGGEWVAAIVLPLALVSIGASLDLKLLRSAGVITFETAAWRLVVAPLLATVVAVALGVSGVELEVFFLLMASPVATASFVMVVASGGNGPLAANVVVITTLLSAVTLPLGLVLLRLLP